MGISSWTRRLSPCLDAPLRFGISLGGLPISVSSMLARGRPREFVVVHLHLYHSIKESLTTSLVIPPLFAMPFSR